MKTKALIRRLASYFPQKLREPYDCGGLMVSKFKEETNKIFLCLDFDDQVLPLIEEWKPDMIITHHPFVFGKKRFVLEKDPIKKALYEKMEKLGVPVVSYHTNFDAAPRGMNDALTEKLGLLNVKPLETAPMARGGDLPHEMEIHEFSKWVIERLGVSYGALVNAGTRTVKNMAIIGGGGWRENENAQAEGYDIYVSGDAPHHARREIILRHYNYLDLPHEIEKIFMPQMTKIILEIDSTLEIRSIDHEVLPEIIKI